jgi:hypothetical protein
MKLLLLIATLLFPVLSSLPVSRAQYPPESEIARYLEFLREEHAELDFQLQRGEIERPFYTRATQRLRILKDLILNHSRSDNTGRLPEFHVALAEELDALIPDGRNKLKRARPHQVIDGKWRFLKTVVRGTTFYVLERLSDSPDQGSIQ